MQPSALRAILAADAELADEVAHGEALGLEDGAEVEDHVGVGGGGGDVRHVPARTFSVQSNPVVWRTFVPALSAI